MPKVLVFSGAGLYADPWHPFRETSTAVAGVLRDQGLDVVVRDSEPGSLLDVASFDVLVVNSGGRTSRAEPAEVLAWADDRRALEAFHHGGGPILGLHTAIGTFPDWPEWPAIIGGRWNADSHHPEISTAAFEPTQGAAGHAVWEGLHSVVVFDEQYSSLEVFGGSTPLIQHQVDGVAHTMGWLVGESVIYDGLGHDGRSYESEDRRRLLVNEMEWLLSR